MNLPPAVVVQGLDDVRIALRPGLPVTFLSAPAAACHAGVGWWRALMQLARQEARAELVDVLDCGESPGLAVDALRAGCGVIVLSAALPAWPDIAERARGMGALLLPVRPIALPRFQARDARQVQSWLRDSRATFG